LTKAVFGCWVFRDLLMARRVCFRAFPDLQACSTEGRLRRYIGGRSEDAGSDFPFICFFKSGGGWVRMHLAGCDGGKPDAVRCFFIGAFDF